MDMPAVHFINEHKSIDVLPGANLRTAALKSGIQLYKPFERVFHLNVKLGPFSFPCSSDAVEISDAKGINPRTQDEERLLEGRFFKKKITPAMRLACQVVVNGDMTVRTLPPLDNDVVATKKALGYVGVLALFLLLMLVMFGMMALDLVKKL